jgi:hypothetical protein
MIKAFRFAMTCTLAAFVATMAVAAFNPTPDFTKGDPEKGKVVYQRIGNCVNCHGWAGDGRTGRNPLSHSIGANIRETNLDPQGLYDVIRCGLPGTQMPYHDQVSYKDDRCFGLTMKDFALGAEPVRGKTMREAQMVDLVAYLEKYVIGHGAPNYEECALYFGGSADKSCAAFKGK